MELDQIYSELIMEHNTSGRNKRHIDSPNLVLKGVNPSCGDEIELELRVRDGVIEDASFTGIGCAISQASASMMIDVIKGKSVDEGRKLAQTFLGMIKGEVTGESELEALEDAVALKNISKMPARVKCAVLGWHTLEDGLGKQDSNKQDLKKSV